MQHELAETQSRHEKNMNLISFKEKKKSDLFFFLQKNMKEIQLYCIQPLHLTLTICERAILKALIRERVC